MEAKNNIPKNQCPIPETHARINQAFSLFQNILEDYQDKMRFTSALNNLIQNIRNVTFVLQKELAHNDGFSDWYSRKQDEMKKDESLRWLVNARNHIVKQGDLKKKSYTKVRLKDHYDHEMLAMELDPALSTREIATNFCKNVALKIPENLLAQTIIEVERVWIVEEYPKAEIIDILIYCLGSVTNLVYSAHAELLGVNALLCEANIFIDPLQDFLSALHNKIKQGRITRINYKTGEIYRQFTEQIFRPDIKLLEKVRKHYGDQKPISILMDKSGTDLPFNNIRFHIEMAKHLFNVDGYLIPMAFLYFPDHPPTEIVLGLDDPASKYLIFEHLAEIVEETGCQALVIVAEAWSGNLPKKGEKYVPAHIQQKNEFIWIVATTPEKTQSYQIEILRDKEKKPMLKAEKEITMGKFPALDRIYRVWGQRKNIK